MKKKSLFKSIVYAIAINAVLLTTSLFSQTTPTVLIDNIPVMAYNVSGSPYWLSEGQSLEPGNLVNMISVLQYNIATAAGGGNTLQFESVLSVTSSQTVPNDKAWKIESVGIDPSAAVFGGDNLGNHVATTHLSMSNFKIGGVADAVSTADAVNSATLQKGNLIYAVDFGIADAYAINLSPPVSAYYTGMTVVFTATNDNTGTVTSTLNVNGLGAKAIKKQGGTSDLGAGDIVNGQIVTAVYDGTNFQIVGQLGAVAAGIPHGKQTFKSNGNFIVPAGVTEVWVSMCGGGGSGGFYGPGGGGGGAANALNLPVSVTPLEVIPITIGTGGAPVSGPTNANGNSGTASTFGSYITTGGGGAGSGGGGGGAGGTGSSGTIPGQPGVRYTTSVGGSGGNSLFGFGGNTSSSSGVAGIGYGSGGSGNSTSSTSTGAGAPGIVIVEW